jgi:hypothetical protein
VDYNRAGEWAQGRWVCVGGGMGELGLGLGAARGSSRSAASPRLRGSMREWLAVAALAPLYRLPRHNRGEGSGQGCGFRDCSGCGG